MFSRRCPASLVPPTHECPVLAQCLAQDLGNDIALGALEELAVILQPLCDLVVKTHLDLVFNRLLQRLYIGPHCLSSCVAHLLPPNSRPAWGDLHSDGRSED